jgi:chromate transporter
LALSITHLWQVGVLAIAAVWLLALRRGVVSALLLAAGLGLGAALLGWPT